MELICECGYFKSGYNRDHVIVLNKMVNEFLQSMNHMKLAIVSGSNNVILCIKVLSIGVTKYQWF